MLNLSKPESAPTLVSDPSDIRIGELLAAIDGHREKPLIFSYGGRPVRAGYHVTEVKAAIFRCSTAAPTRKRGRRSSSSCGTSTKASAST